MLMKLWWSKVNTELIFWYFWRKECVISSSWIKFGTRYESNQNSQERRDKHLLKYVVHLLRTNIHPAARDQSTQQAAGNSVFVTDVLVTDFDFVPTPPFFGEVTKQQEPVLAERKTSSLDLHHTGLGSRLRIWQKNLEKIILFRETLFISAPSRNRLWPSLQDML